MDLLRIVDLFGRRGNHDVGYLDSHHFELGIEQNLGAYDLRVENPDGEVTL